MSTLMQEEDSENVWATLAFPLSDLLLQEIAPKYLTVKDFLQLGAVSKRYKTLLGPKTPQGNRILGLLLQQEAKKYHPVSGELLYTEQLPTIGNLSVEESLKEDAILVAQLRGPAHGRRSLIQIPTPQTDEQRLNLRETIANFQPMPVRTMMAVARKYRQLDLKGVRTEFLGVNLSGVPIYCHFIDEQNQQLLVRDGDCVPPASDSNVNEISSFVVDQTGSTALRYVFRHSSSISHSFALCFQEGGPPFCIYQQRRGWYRNLNRGLTGVMHTHAIAIRPGGVVEELHCDSNWEYYNVPNSFTGYYDFYDRQTNALVPVSTEVAGEDEEEQEEQAGEEVVATAAATVEQEDDNEALLERAKEFAKAYYGLRVPSITLTPGYWNRGGEGALAEHLGESSSPALSRINPLGEAIWHEDKVFGLPPANRPFVVRGTNSLDQMLRQQR